MAVTVIESNTPIDTEQSNYSAIDVVANDILRR